MQLLLGYIVPTILPIYFKIYFTGIFAFSFRSLEGEVNIRVEIEPNLKP